MIQVRLHGRGGQGVVTAAELIAIAAFKDQKFSQAFPSFGVERTGAPIEAFSRIDNKFIRTREQVYDPNILVVLDPSLLESAQISTGCDKKTKIVINSRKSKKEIAISFRKNQKLSIPEKNIFVLDATSIALKILGKNLANTVILGALAKATKIISFAGLKQAIKEKFEEKSSDMINKNLEAIKQAYEEKY